MRAADLIPVEFSSRRERGLSKIDFLLIHLYIQEVLGCSSLCSGVAFAEPPCTSHCVSVGCSSQVECKIFRIIDVFSYPGREKICLFLPISTGFITARADTLWATRSGCATGDSGRRWAEMPVPKRCLYYSILISIL